MAESHSFTPRSDPIEVVRVPLPTPWGTFDVRAFETASGHVYLALVHGDVRGHDGVLTRVHSECLTGDTLGSLRCDCGIQLRLAMRFIAAEDRGVLVYATDHEARGIGLVNKLRAYAMQDDGCDTIDANLALGFPVDARDYGDAARVLGTLGLSSITLLTNNPDKVRGLREGGIEVVGVRRLATTPHTRNLHYLRTKERKLGHVEPTGAVVSDGATRPSVALDVTALLGEPLAPADRPYVVLKFAQTLDGRIATSTGDAKWISGEDERRVSHALRAASDAVLVGVGTVIQDDPQLTVRMVDGMSPKRVVLDSTLRLPMSAKILDLQAPTCVVTTMRAPAPRRDELQQRGVHVEITPAGPRGVDLEAALASLRASGIETLLVEGGARVITSMLAGGLVDRVIVGVAPTIIGQGTEAVGALGTVTVSEGIRLVDRALLVLDDDVLLAWTVDSRR
jgi:3,4-dihydroxy 2-butanone 4-phosphate synthase/GTP cyclohydrolase II